MAAQEDILTLIATPETVRDTEKLAWFLDGIDDLISHGDGGSRIGQLMRQGYEENFANERAGDSGPLSGPWKQLAKSTVKDRIRHGFGGSHPILVRTGRYKRSWTTPGGKGHISRVEHDGRGIVRWIEGSKDFRAGWMEWGTPRMPARRVSTVSLKYSRKLSKAINMICMQLQP